MEKPKILVLGVGNLLLKDEGVGVHVVTYLQRYYHFSDNVELLDGGTQGLRLLDPISQADVLIVVDAVRRGREPGTLYRMNADEINKRVTFKNSIHQFDLVETLAYAEVLGKRPEAIVLGVEPAEMDPWGTELTESVVRVFEDLVGMVLGEIRQAGGDWERREGVGRDGMGEAMPRSLSLP